MIPADLHNHTCISHGKDQASAMLAAAQKRGLAWYGFTEHSPLPSGYECPLYQGDLAWGFPSYVEEVLRLQAESSQPQVLLGLELDWLPDKQGYSIDLVRRWPFDYVLGSVHFLAGLPVGSPRSWGEDVGEEERYARYAAYYAETAALARSGLVHAVAHVDFIKIRCIESFRHWLSQTGSLDMVADALSAMKAAGVAMELSSAGLRRPCAEPYPGPAVMRLAADMGLPIVIGSDAHAASEVAAQFDYLEEYARSFGYRESLIFIQGQAQSLSF
ncbi:MAG: histidinol-phosphatase [Desulfovibrio sp.]|nr:histidinol-phosphatase [Desulfovibrio sp.]